MTENIESKTDLKIRISIGLLTSIYVLNWLRLLQYDRYETLFQSSRIISYDLETFVQNIFLFALPICIILFYLKRKISYYIILFYLSFEFLWELPRFLIVPFEMLRLFSLVLTLICFFYILYSELRSVFNISKNDILLTFTTVLLLVLADYIPESIYLFLPLTLILLIVIPVWDQRLLRNRNLEVEKGISKSEFFRTKFKITVLPLLVLLPWFLVIEKKLLGPSFHLSDHMWGNSYHIPNKYYDITMYSFLCLPSIISFFWFYIASRSKVYLKQFAKNFLFTLALNYLLINILYILNLLSIFFMESQR